MGEEGWENTRGGGLFLKEKALLFPVAVPKILRHGFAASKF